MAWKDNLWQIVQAGAMLLMAAAFYFDDASAMKQRIVKVEVQVDQEMRGYENLQAAIGERLRRVEDKLDRLVEQRAQP